MQTTPLEGMAPETFLDVERFQHYGITTLPPEGATAIYTDERASIILKKGTILETTCNDWHLKCKKAVIKASDSMMVKTPKVTATQKVTVQRPLTGQSGMSVGGTMIKVQQPQLSAISTTPAAPFTASKSAPTNTTMPDGESGTPHN
ncbi:Mu-like prophage protein gp45 [Cedecea neteri]|uniref:Mu-like prophage protein gp45 n=1 Tax=Cedecea neteri TaxID=158822 RepID=A0A2X3J7P0_9ENTR|nr:Mu-like prophage protein gp45 [Cedecea neteri]